MAQSLEICTTKTCNCDRCYR
nr:unnamed protein product [Callosobruchus chinensis]